MTVAAAENAELDRISSGRRWAGFLTLANAEAVAGRIRTLLEGNRYPFAACGEISGSFPRVEVRTRQQADTIPLSARQRTAERNGPTSSSATPPRSGAWTRKCRTRRLRPTGRASPRAEPGTGSCTCVSTSDPTTAAGLKSSSTTTAATG